MARTRRNKVSRARRGVPVRGEKRIVRSPVNDPAVASIARNQHFGIHLRTLSDIMGSNLVPSSGVEVQTSCLAAGLDVHQPICMGLQPSRTDLDVLPLAEFDATQPLESTDIGAANLQPVFPHEFGNQSSASIHASPFQYYGLLTSTLSCGAGNPTSNALNAAPTAPRAPDYGFPVALSLGPEVIRPLPEILPLTEAEELHRLDQLLPPAQDQILENAYSLSPNQQLYHLNHLEEPIHTVNYDPPSHSHMSQSMPLNAMIHHSATHPQSFPFGHWHQQSPQQPLTDLLDGDMQKQLLGSAPFHSSSSREAMEYPPSLNSTVIPANVPHIVEAAPTVNITPFDSLAQQPATKALPNSAHIPNGSVNHTDVAARIVTAGQGRVSRNRLPQLRQATTGGLRPAPTADASPATMNLAEVMLGRIETQRQKHIKSERKKRQHMNEMYATIRSLLPPASRKTRPNNATVVTDMIDYIKSCQNELEMLEQQLKHSQQLGAALCNVNPSIHHTDSTAAARLLSTKGYTCVDHTHDPSALTAVTTLPEVGNDSGLASFLGANVAINYCQNNYSLTVSSPYLGQAVALLELMLIAIKDHHLEVLLASIVTTGNTHIYSLQCKASSDAEMLRNDLHSVLQGIVNDFPSSSSSHEHQA